MSYKPLTFDAVLEDEIATLAEPTAQLGAGACMHITPRPPLQRSTSMPAPPARTRIKSTMPS